MTNAYSVVAQFEERVAARFGFKYGIAVDCCTSAIFLALKFRQASGFADMQYAVMPARTYISVPFACLDAGIEKIMFHPKPWERHRAHYRIEPWAVHDAALYWKNPADHSSDGIGIWCLSFHVKKPIPIGRGGMILTNEFTAERWLRRARYDGREGKPYSEETITTRGWHRYMTPEQAARGLSLMDTYPEGVDVPEEQYPDLRDMPIFAG